MIGGCTGGVRARQVAEACLDQLQALSGFRACGSRAYGGEGVVGMIAAVSIGIIIIIAVIVAALVIIYFILKGSPR
jgi:hypothetical protein